MITTLIKMSSPKRVQDSREVGQRSQAASATLSYEGNNAFNNYIKYLPIYDSKHGLKHIIVLSI